DLALLHRSLGGAVLDVDGDDVPDGGDVAAGSLFGDHVGLARAGVVGDFENGTELDHDEPPGELRVADQTSVSAGAESCLTSAAARAAATSTSAERVTMRRTRKRFRRLSGRVSMISTLSPTWVSFFS